MLKTIHFKHLQKNPPIKIRNNILVDTLAMSFFGRSPQQLVRAKRRRVVERSEKSRYYKVCVTEILPPFGRLNDT